MQTSFALGFTLTPLALAAAGGLAMLVQGPAGGEDPEAVERGRVLFDKNFHVADGLGLPEMNGDSCRACHQDPAMGGAGPLEVNVSRFARDNAGQGPFQNLPGGQMLSKLYPPTTPGREEHPNDFFTGADCFEQRQTPSLFGGGMIDDIPGWVITANEDPTDANGDGIYGVARRLDINGTIEIGRFGWKGQIPHLRDFVKDAMGGEMGITTPAETRAFGERSDGDGVADPELSSPEIDDLAAFMRALPAPERGGRAGDPEVQLGEQLFESVGCAVCHVPVLQDAVGRPVPLYSNLLLHDVMPADFRGMHEEGAGVGLYRTPPLWGIKDTAPYMHDGRAETLHDAIMSHFSEAAAARLEYEALSPQQQAQLIAFLEDL